MAAVGAGSACGIETTGLEPKEPAAAPAPIAAADPGGSPRIFFDNFNSGDVPRWEPLAGAWRPDRATGAAEYVPVPGGFGLTVAGPTAWANYRVEAKVVITDDRKGPVGLVIRAQRSHHYFELVLGRDDAGRRTWFLRQRVNHIWTPLASGPFAYPLGEPFSLRIVAEGKSLRAFANSRMGTALSELGSATAPNEGWRHGKFGLVTYGGAARFDDVEVRGGGLIALVDPQDGWGPVVELRDASNSLSGRLGSAPPSGGWYVTTIHATVRASDGKVLLTGFGRRAEANCSNGASGTQREVGETWLLDPVQIDALSDGQTLFVTPIDELNLDPATDVLYCAGHNTLADGRIFFAAGTRYPDQLPDSGPERGVTYTRMYNPAVGPFGSFTRIAANMKGGQNVANGMPSRGEKWYPTQLLLPDGRVLIFGGFHWSTGGPGVKPNYSLELFDPSIWDANANADPFTVLTQHEEGHADTPPTRGYTNLLLLPKPVPAASAGGLARSVVVSGGVGRVFLYNHEPGPAGGARLFARPNALSPNPSSNEKGEGAPSVMLTDGTVMFTNGGHSGSGSATAYFYDPYADSWTTLPLGISRMYSDAVQLPDGKVLVVNGYQSEPGNIGDIASPVGDPRAPQLIDPYANPRTVDTLDPWPEPTHRGYHSIAVLLKDGRVLIGGGKDTDHNTGCEKNELRIYEPPYLRAGPRPAIQSPVDGTNFAVGGAPLTIQYSGSVRPDRGVVLMAPGSLTHAFDSGQRYVPLQVTSGPSGGTLTVAPPENINVAQPGDYLLFLISDSGVPSQGVHIRLNPPPPCRYAVNGNVDSYIEAEARSRQSGPFTTISDDGRSAGAYVGVTEGSGNHSTAPDEGKVLWYDVDVSNGGSFHIWALANALDSGSNSFWVSIDGNADQQIDLPTPGGAWGWVTLGTTVSLPSGRHQLKVKVREDGARIDKLLLTKNGALVPSGLGSTGLVCNGPPGPPGAPIGLTATPGSGQVSLSWSPVSGASTYTVKRSTSSGGPFLAIRGSLPTPSYTDTGLSNGETYHYVVSAWNIGGEGPDSSPASATPQTSGLYLEAESGTRTAPMTVQADATASGGQYITATGSGNSTGAPPSTGHATIPFSVPQAGTYRVWGRVIAPSTSVDSFWVRVDAGAWVKWNEIPVGSAWHWDDVHDADAGNAVVGFPLSAGQHTLTVAYRERGTHLDRVFITADPNATPVDGPVDPPPPPPPPPPTTANIYLEGEAATLSAPMTALSDAAASGGQYITAAGSGNSTGAPPATGHAAWSFTAPSAGTYRIWGRVIAPSTSLDSFWVRVDGGTWVKWNEIALGGSWHWDEVHDADAANTVVPFDLAAGEHTLTIAYRERNTWLDRVFITNDLAAVPSDGPPTEPGAPGNLQAFPDDGQVELSWSAASGAATYTVRRATSATGPFADIQTGITDTSFTDVGLVNFTPYHYVVFASNAVGPGPDSNPASATPQPAPAAPVSDLVVNDTNTGNGSSAGDGIPNDTQWTIQSNLQVGATAFGDRAYSVTALASALAGKPWIRTAADSKGYTGSSELATFTVGGSAITLLVDNRHGTTPAWLAGYTAQSYGCTVTEGSSPRLYTAWKKTVTPGSTVSLPSIGSTSAPTYLVVVE